MFCKIKQKRSFLLQEYLIYLFLFSIFALLVFQLFFNTYKESEFYKDIAHVVVNTEVLFNYVRGDLMSASKKIDEWDKDNFVFRKKELDKQQRPVVSDVGWEVVVGRVRRIKGIYDFENRRWIKKHYVSFDLNVEKFFIDKIFMERGEIRVVKVILQQKNGVSSYMFAEVMERTL